MPHIMRTDRNTQKKNIIKKLYIFIFTGATSCYTKSGIYENKKELLTYISIIKYYHILTIFKTKYLFYEREGLESVLLIGYNLLRKIGAKMDAAKGIMEYNGKKEELEYYGNEEKNDLCLIWEKLLFQ